MGKVRIPPKKPAESVGPLFLAFEADEEREPQRHGKSGQFRRQMLEQGVHRISLCYYRSSFFDIGIIGESWSPLRKW